MPDNRIKLHTLAGIVTGAFTAAFAIYFMERRPDALTLGICGGCFLIFCAVVWRSIARLENPQPVYVNPDYMDTRQTLPVLCASAGAVLLLHIVLALGIHSRYPDMGIFQAFAADLINDVDVRSYQQLAESWYSSGTALPFFPALIRAFSLTGNFFPTAVIISAACVIGSGIYVYRLALLDYDRQTAFRAIKYMYIFPAGFFFAVPLAGSISLFFSVLFMYLVRKRYYWYAALAGFCAALSDVSGALVIVAALVEAVNEYRRPATGRPHTPPGLYPILPLAGILAGFGCYLYINHAFYGNAFYFLNGRYAYFEHTSWYFWDTAAYLVAQTKVWLSGAPGIAYAVSIPNLCCMFIILLLLLANIRLSYVFYGICYFFLSYGILGDLNTPRHTIGLFPLAIAAAALTKSKPADICLTIAYAIGFILYFYFSVC